ncbi:unnamed protein product, partial [Mesorhabditis belari]|uniref:Ubiquitin-like domain-containing protein n=1 Tax=Mesorhabditis belari TaxID=2138241 RepID=A0AAF3FMJ0_9BILA
MNLRVKILDGRDISLTPSPSTSLEQFKELIFQQTGIPANRQRLIYQGRPLTNNSGALETLGIQDGHVIHLVERPEQ